MDIRNTRALKAFAAERLSGAPLQKKTVLIYSGLVMGLALLSTVIHYVLGLQIGQMGGLSQMSQRTILATVQSMLPLLQSLVVMCLELGYMAAMLRIARGQHSSPNTLRLGFDRFWTLLRCAVIQGLIYAGLAVAAVYFAAMLFVMLPFGQPFMERMSSLTAGTSLLNPQITLDDAMIMELVPTMLPMFLMAAAAACLLILPVTYQFRMSNYIIIDKPGMGAMYALLESRKMMRGNCLKLLKLDLSYWWYFLVLLAVGFIANLDQYLVIFGVTLPIPAEAAYFGFYILYLSLQMAAYCFLRNPVEVSYGLFYDAVKPKEEPQNGVILGNIFDM